MNMGRTCSRALLQPQMALIQTPQVPEFTNDLAPRREPDVVSVKYHV